jgi:hypothetical protein
MTVKRRGIFAPALFFAKCSAPLDGREPARTLFPDAAGRLFGTTFYGGGNNAGTVFRIAE